MSNPNTYDLPTSLPPCPAYASFFSSSFPFLSFPSSILLLSYRFSIYFPFFFFCKGSKAGKCGKFFGKHKDVKHQQFFLKKESFVYAVGTPARTSALSETGMLKFGALAAVLVDGSWINPLGRTLLEQAESRRDLHLFLKNHLIKHCKSKGTKIVLF